MPRNATVPRRLDSSWIRSAHYSRGVLTLLKDDGGAMVYRNVPSWVMACLCRVKSPGQFYNRRIKGRYAYTPVNPPTPPGPSSEELQDALRRSLEVCGRVGGRPTGGVHGAAPRP